MRIEHQEHSFFCFDFDGVILDTVALKAEGFVYAFGDISETHRSVILEYQLKNGGQDKITHNCDYSRYGVKLFLNILQCLQPTTTSVYLPIHENHIFHR